MEPPRSPSDQRRGLPRGEVAGEDAGLDDRLPLCGRALVVPSEGAQAERGGRIGRDVHVLGAVAQASEVTWLEEARPRVGGLGAVDAIELRGMADGLVHLKRHLLGVDDDGRDSGRAGVGRQERGRLLADPGRLAVQPERLHELPARLAARAAVSARKAPVLHTAVVRDGERVDAAAALHEALCDARALGGAEDALLAHGADGRLGDLHLGPPHALLGPETERDLLLQRHLDGVSLEGRRVFAGGRRDGRQLHAYVRPRGARAGEGDRPDGCVASSVLGEPRVAGEAPGSVDEHTHADALGLRVGDRVNLAVLGRHELCAALHDPGVRVAGPCGESGIDRVSGEVLQGRSYIRAPHVMMTRRLGALGGSRQGRRERSYLQRYGRD